MSKLTFLVRGPREALTARPRPFLVLTTDNWDDFGHKVQFHLAYIDKGGVETRLGAVKILQRVSGAGKPVELASTTKLPKQFAELDDTFISLGQEDDYYLTMRELLGDATGPVLEALRDIAWRPALSVEFEPLSAFRNALLRENGAQRARRFGASWASGEAVNEDLAFTYVGTIAGADESVEARFLFDRRDPVPGRIVGIIGRNAVGKTRFLSSLANDLAQTSRASAERVAEREGRFPGGRPLFTRLLAISYSAFDRFKRPEPHPSSSYVYCGIRNDRGALSRQSLSEAYRRNQARIRARGSQYDWASHLKVILGDHSGALTASLLAEFDDNSASESALSRLSSGQAILAHFVTALIAWIQPNSLVLFDEPETHLHPNAVASLFLVLSDVLSEYDSYAVVATHSPVVIQEIPAKRVLMFERDGNVTTATPLPVESFGESVTQLTQHVFETREVESLYRRTLKQLAQDESAEAVQARFESGLSLNAQAYLLAQYSKKVGKTV